MQSKAHVCVQTQTHADRARRARTDELSARLSQPNELTLRWVLVANGVLEMRWQPRFESRGLIARSRGAGA